MTPERSTQPAGIAYSVGAYLLWGVLPLYFLLLVPTGPWEVVAARVIFSLVFCLLLLTATRGWRRIMVIIRQPRLLGWTAPRRDPDLRQLAGVPDRNPQQQRRRDRAGLLHQPDHHDAPRRLRAARRIRRLQWVAIGVAVLAVVVIIVAYGSFPWIALLLTASFGTYGLIKKKIGPAVDAVSGLTLESFWLVPIAVVQLIVVAQTTGITFGTVSPWHTALLLFAGVATAVPLLLFASGARRINLTVIGMIQFITPIMQFLTGVLILHEPMPFERWVGFILVWIAVAVFVVDMLLAARRSRASLSI